MSQDKLKVRVVINQGGENQSDLEAPLKPVSGVEQAQVIRVLQSGKMNETSDAYAVDEKYTYNYRRIFSAFFLMLAFFMVATSYFVGRTQPHIQTASPLQSESSQEAESIAQGSQSAETVTAIPGNERANQAATPVSSVQLVEALTKIESAETGAGTAEFKSAHKAEKIELASASLPESSSVTSGVTPQSTQAAKAPTQVVAPSQSAAQGAAPTQVANIGNLQTRILEPALVTNSTFLGSMIKKEPGIPLASQLPFDENHLIRVFFYLETKNLKGKWLRQHWYYQDKKMATVTSFIKANAFKTHSSKFIRHNWAGSWQVVVSVIDQPNQAETKERKLVEGRFDVAVESRTD